MLEMMASSQPVAIEFGINGYSKVFNPSYARFCGSTQISLNVKTIGTFRRISPENIVSLGVRGSLQF